MEGTKNKNGLIGNNQALYYSDLFSALGVPHPTRKYFKPTELVIGFKDLDAEELQHLESKLQRYFGKGIPESVSVPGLHTRTIFTRNETDYKTDSGNYQYPYCPDSVITYALLDLWLQTKNAGQCVYIVGASDFHTEIERWNPPSSPINRHATLRVTSKMQSTEYDRSQKFKRKMADLIDSLPLEMNDEDVHRAVVKLDQPSIQSVYLLREEDSKFLIENFLPGYRILSLGGYPELVHESE